MRNDFTMHTVWRDIVGAVASVGFILIAAAAIQYQEQLSPRIERVFGDLNSAAMKTAKTANVALRDAAYSLLLRIGAY